MGSLIGMNDEMFIDTIYKEVIPAIDKTISQSMLECRDSNFVCALEKKDSDNYNKKFINDRIDKLNGIISEYLNTRKSAEVKGDNNICRCSCHDFKATIHKHF